ncbi:hypothetical protein EJ02DRAFT_460831, partial [Clathrospora elynae]
AGYKKSVSSNLAPITFALLSKKCLGQALLVRCLWAAKDSGSEPSPSLILSETPSS